MKKRIVAFILALVTVLQLCSMIPIIAEDRSVIGEYVKFKNLNDNVYCYKEVTYNSTSTAAVTRKASLFPETLVILDVIVNQYDIEYYKVGTVDGSSDEVLDNYPWIKSAFFDIVEKPVELPQPVVTLNGKPVEDITLYEDGKMQLVAVKPAEIKGEVSWGWEILADAEKDLWIRIGDKTTNVCNITYALVKNLLDDSGKVKVRSVAYDEEGEYPSAPITVTMAYRISEIKPTYDKMFAESGNVVSPLAEEDVGTITITINYVKVRPDGSREKAAYENVRTLRSDYAAYPVTLPSVLGYYPSLQEPSNPYNFSDNPQKDSSFTTYDVPAGYTKDTVITVYYYPGEAKYTVYHYQQDLLTDEYILNSTETKTAVVDKAIPDSHKDYEGFLPLYYERTEVAVDGSTVIEIYYDREYFPLMFDLVHPGAFGMESQYLKYGSSVTVNSAQCKGWEFDGWIEVDENGNPLNASAEKVKNFTIVVTAAHYYLASYHGVASSYTVVYWFENADNGYYTIRYTEEINATSGEFAVWNDVIPQNVIDYINENYNDYEFFTYDAYKTQQANRTLINPDATSDEDKYRDGVVIQGDGSTTVNVYFARRYYKITFMASVPSAGGKLEEHTHGDGSCVYNPMYCLHQHTAACRTDAGGCNREEHIHSAACRNCDLTEHIHGPECCTVHTHTTACYSNVDNLTDALTDYFMEKVREAVQKDVESNGVLEFLGWDALTQWVVNTAQEQVGGEAETTAQKIGDDLKASIEKNPPQNLQNGYIYVLKNQTLTYSIYKEIKQTILFWEATIHTVNIQNETITVDIPAIYIDGEWYYYNGQSVNELKEGQIVQVDTEKCKLPNHDHTGGCNAESCPNGGVEHVHTDLGSYNCGKQAHTHSQYCNCTHIHTEECYNYHCMKPEHDHTHDGDDGEQVIRTLIAKYGQDITAYVPYYLELSELGLHKNANGDTFTYWKYDSTGTSADGEISRYVKHMTMEKELCYSNGIITRAQYSSNVSPYVLFYLFESFDTTSGVQDFNYTTGSARQWFNGKYYDSDPIHMQIVMLDNTDDGALAQLNSEAGKTIYGMEACQVQGNPAVQNVTIGGVTYTRYACFYDRKLTSNVILQNNGVEYEKFSTDANGGELKYGALVEEIMEGYKTIGRFDYLNVPLPEGFEEGAYEFAGWYTTPSISPESKVDWSTLTLPIGDFNLFAHWTPIIRDVYIYEDATLDDEKLLAHKEVPNGNTIGTVDYSNSQYVKDGYTFVGWFYLDANGVEQQFYMNSLEVRHDMTLYAKWKMDKMVPYRINYVWYDEENGAYVPVADSLVGTAVAGQHHTFFPEIESGLYQDYREGYIPEIGSHTVQMLYNDLDPDDEVETLEVNEYTFIYQKVPYIEYYIRYVDENGDDLIPMQRYETRKGAVAPLFVYIEGYTADQYRQELVLVTEEPEVNNVITFTYTKNESDDPIEYFWFINHMFENADGTYFLGKQEKGVTTLLPSETPTICYATVLTFDHYHFADKADVKTRYMDGDTLTETVVELSRNSDGTYGYQLNTYGIEINLYYDRDDVGYTVIYKGVDTVENGNVILGETLYEYEVGANASQTPHGDMVTVEIDAQKRLEILYNKGYDLQDASKTSISLVLNEDASKNVVIFLFEKFNATFEYQIIGAPIGAGLDNTADSTPAGDDGSLLIGSAPYESDTYYFAGWYADAECKTPLDGSYAVSIDPVTNKLIPTKTEFEDANGNRGELYLSATYYALFLPRSSTLTVTVNADASDSFILNFVGTSAFSQGTEFKVAIGGGQTVTVVDVPVGTYSVTLDEAWSWRYPQLDNKSVDVAVQVGGTLTLVLDADKTQWLTDSAIGAYQPGSSD